MGALDQVKSYFTGDVNIDNPEVRQALKNAFPTLAMLGNEFDELRYLPKDYIQNKITPELLIMEEAKLQAFKMAIANKSEELHNLATDIENNLRYKPRTGKEIPGTQQAPDKVKSSAKSLYKDMTGFLADIANLRTDAEKEQALLAEIIASANRSVVKFDQYVLRGDGLQYGDNANQWYSIKALENREVRRPANNKKISASVENISKVEFANVVNDVVAMAQSAGPNISINGQSGPVGNGTRIDKLAYLASWMSALEEGVDKVLPNMVAEAATKAVTGTVSTFGGTLWDGVTGVAGEYPIWTTLAIGAFGYATWRTGNLIKGIINIPSIPVRLAAKAMGAFTATKGIAPHLDRFADIISVKDAVSPSTPAGTPGSNPSEGPRTPRRFVAVNPADLKDFKPGEANHLEYYKKTLDAIKALGVAPAAGTPAAGTPLLTADEVNVRTSKFMNLDEEYRRGGMSLAEYLKRSEDIMKGFGKVFVKDNTGKIDWSRTWRNTLQRVADRTPLVSQMTRNMPNGSQVGSVNAITAAKNRIKGTSYETVDYTGAKVEFENTQAKALFEEFRDKLERYSQMQEWDATNREIVSKEGLKTQIRTTDIPAKQAEITAKAAVIGSTPHTVPGAPMVVGGRSVPTQVPNPLLVTLNEDLRELQKDLRDLNTQVQTLNSEVATLRGKPHSYVPAGGTRAQFQTDIRALKLEISNPAAGGAPGLIQRINTHAGSTVVPDTAFSPKDLKIDKVRLLEVVKLALKK